MFLQTGGVKDLHHLAGLFHRPIPGELTLGLGPGLFRRMPAGERIRRFDVARDLRGNAQPNPSAAHLRQTNGSSATILFVGQTSFAQADFFNRSRQIAIPLQRINRRSRWASKICIETVQ